MRLIRSCCAVLVGYFIFAVTAFAFFRISGQPPHQEAPVSLMMASICVGVIAAFLGGFVAAWLAGRGPLIHGACVASVLAFGATVSLLATLGHGAVWSQVAALALMAPSACLGGWARARASPKVQTPGAG